MNKSRAASPRILIAGGGTGGHVFPALAIRQAIAQIEPNAEVIFVGTRHGLEAKVMPQQNETLKTLWISGFSRSHPLKNVLLPFKLAASFAQSFELLTSFRPQVVIGTGGYVMGPILWTAQRLGIPTLVQEQNSHPGYTTRKLAAKASAVCVGFEEAKARLSASHVEVTGNPLRASFRAAEPEAARKRWNLDRERQTILVFGGSAGARSINQAVAGALSSLLQSYNLIWQTGRLGVPDSVERPILTSATESRHLKVLEFIEDMTGAYAVSELAVCRAGAMTLAELAMTGVPAVLVPYPFATDDHQTANAKSIESRGAAAVIKDSELSPDALLVAVQRCMQSKEKLSSMSEHMKSLARPEAAAQIAQIALSLARPS